eukprot:2153-Heterococcus_DN1.PRE.8
MAPSSAPTAMPSSVETRRLMDRFLQSEQRSLQSGVQPCAAAFAQVARIVDGAFGRSARPEIL